MHSGWRRRRCSSLLADEMIKYPIPKGADYIRIRNGR